MTNLPPLTKQQVCDAQWNKSLAKMLYTFPKADRFRDLKPTNRPIAYELPSTKMIRTTTMGWGERSDFTKGKRAPIFYKVKRDFDEGTQIGPMYSLGQPREVYKKVFNPNSMQADSCVPGPGTYHVKETLGEENPQYSMAPKTFVDENKGRRGFPGPGTYENKLEINGDGLVPVSTIENTRPVNFSLYKDKRFNYKCKTYFFLIMFIDNKNPAPNQYKIRGLIGRPLFNSKYGSSKMITMGPLTTFGGRKDNFPGPGSYKVYSEFGDIPKLKKRKNKKKKKKEN